MAHGLQVWDSSGNIILDTTTVTKRLLGNITVTSATSGSLTIPVSSGKSAFAYFYISGLVNCTLSISGTTLNYSVYAEPGYAFPSGGVASIFYGEK